MDDVNKKSNKGKRIISIILKIILILFIVFIIAGMALYFYILNQNKIIANTNINAISDTADSLEYGSSMSYES